MPMRRVLQDAFLIRWQSSIALTCMLLLGAAATAQQVWLGTYPATIAAEFRGQIGRRITFLCPATAPQSTNKVWGTDTYTDDSWVCAAAVHAGVLPRDKPGVVTIVMGAGAGSFQGSQRNGVTSQGFGAWESSYTFSQTAEPGQVDWKTAFMYMPIRYLDPVVVLCPPDGKIEARIWGTDVYTYDSSICVAAVHAGLISPTAGGKVAVTMHATGLDSYPATTRNGVSSLSWVPGAGRDYPYSFGVTRAAIAASLPSARNPEAGVELKDANLSRTIDLPAVAAVGTSESVKRRTIDLPEFKAVGTSSTVEPRTIDLPRIIAVGTSETIKPRTIDLPGVTAAGTSTTVAPRTIDLPGITATGAFPLPIARTFTATGFTGSGAPPPPITRTFTATGFTGSGAPPPPITRTYTTTGFTGSGIPKVAPKSISPPPELPPGGGP